MILETDRLIIRGIKESDLEDYHEYSSQEGIGESAGWRHHTSIDMSKMSIYHKARSGIFQAIELKEENKVIGHISINDDSEDDRDDVKELGFVLNRNYHNRGIMTEAVLEMIDYLFSNGINIIYACCSIDNLASKHLIEKCGFKFIKEGTYYSQDMDKHFNSLEYGYNVNDWLNGK